MKYSVGAIVRTVVLVLILSCLWQLSWDLNRLQPIRSWSAVILAILATMIHSFLGFLRWRSIVIPLKINIRYVDQLEIYIRSITLGQVTPTSIIGDGFRLHSMQKYPFKTNLYSLILDKLSSHLPWVLVGLGVAFLQPILWTEILVYHSLSWLFPWILVGFIICFLLAIFFLYFFKSKVGSKHFFLSVIALIVFVVNWQLVLAAFAVDIGVISLLVLFPLLAFFLVLPVSFNGWGVRELGMVWLLAPSGFAREVILESSILLGGSQLAGNVVLLFLVIGYKKVRRLSSSHLEKANVSKANG